LASYAVKETKIDNLAPFSWYGCISCISVTPINTDYTVEKEPWRCHQKKKKILTINIKWQV